ncbi:hypothetical protein J6590_033737 [Homalodisca vitripennis]|nr:hypothetical protein J6590_033737 [Homalodisca vitripennis]
MRLHIAVEFLVYYSYTGPDLALSRRSCSSGRYRLNGLARAPGWRPTVSLSSVLEVLNVAALSGDDAVARASALYLMQTFINAGHYPLSQELPANIKQFRAHYSIGYRSLTLPPLPCTLLTTPVNPSTFILQMGYRTLLILTVVPVLLCGNKIYTAPSMQGEANSPRQLPSQSRVMAGPLLLLPLSVLPLPDLSHPITNTDLNRKISQRLTINSSSE